MIDYLPRPESGVRVRELPPPGGRRQGHTDAQRPQTTEQKHKGQGQVQGQGQGQSQGQSQGQGHSQGGQGQGNSSDKEISYEIIKFSKSFCSGI